MKIVPVMKALEKIVRNNKPDATLAGADVKITIKAYKKITKNNCLVSQIHPLWDGHAAK